MRTKTSVVLLCVAATAGLAGADTVTIVYQGHAGNLGQDITVQLSGGLFFQDGGSSHSMWAGQLSNLIDGVATKTFCTELTQWVGSGEFEVVSVDEAPRPGSGMGQTKADALYRLFNATDRGANLSTNAEAAAFQAVIWEIVYEYTGDESSMGLATGNVQIASGINPSLFSQYTGYATSLQGDAAPTIAAYVNDLRQDQLGPQVIPLPGAAAMAGLSLAGLGLRRRR